MTPETKLYADRDPCELEPHYSRHVMAMTVEQLHSKADIAAELAWRDAEIQALRKDADRYRLIRGGKQWVVAATQTGSHVDGEHLDELVDDAMEQQK